jgi:hypothetical protein
LNIIISSAEKDYELNDSESEKKYAFFFLSLSLSTICIFRIAFALIVEWLIWFSSGRFGFKLNLSLRRAAQSKLLSGYSVYSTVNVKPAHADFKKIIECAGGQVLLVSYDGSEETDAYFQCHHCFSLPVVHSSDAFQIAQLL